jgi:hypothetical protein
VQEQPFRLPRSALTTSASYVPSMVRRALQQISCILPTKEWPYGPVGRSPSHVSGVLLSLYPRSTIHLVHSGIAVLGERGIDYSCPSC